MTPDDQKQPTLSSIEPDKPRIRQARRRLSWRGELLLATLPTLVVLLVLVFVEVFSRQRLLFASLASSAFLIYLDPNHGTNRVRTLLIAQPLAAVVGYASLHVVPSLYIGAGVAMVITIIAMILLDAVHPPAVSTAIAFAFRPAETSELTVFALAIGMTAGLVLMQRGVVSLLVRIFRREHHGGRAKA